MLTVLGCHKTSTKQAGVLSRQRCPDDKCELSIYGLTLATLYPVLK